MSRAALILLAKLLENTRLKAKRNLLEKFGKMDA